MLLESLRAPLRFAQLVALATLVRSVLFDRWITVAVSLLLLTGVVAARRGRTWGIALAFAMAIAFPTMFLLGMAPPWFCVVGAAGALPFVTALPAFTRFDRHAAALLTLLAGGIGTGVAFAWKSFAWQLFTAFPALRPSLYPHHGLAMVLLVMGATLLAHRRERVAAVAAGPTRINVDDEAAEDAQVRVAALEEADAAASGEDALDEGLRRRAER